VLAGFAPSGWIWKSEWLDSSTATIFENCPRLYQQLVRLPKFSLDAICCGCIVRRMSDRMLYAIGGCGLAISAGALLILWFL
jgi:hypothetical protein